MDSLDVIVDSLDVTSKVYFLSEVGWDTSYFNQRAYDNLITYITNDSQTSGILIDGALTRVDRPEYLNDKLSYWNKDFKEAQEETDNIPNSKQYETMVQRQLEILDQKFHELRVKLPQTKIVYSAHDDDMQFTISAMLNEELLRNLQNVNDKIAKLKGKRNNFRNEYSQLGKQKSELQKVDGSSKQRSGITRRMNTIDQKILNTEENITSLYGERQLYREKKARPAHQQFTKEFIDDFYQEIQKVCDKHQIDLITKPQVIDFDNLKIDYAHSRHSTWTPIKRRDLQFVKGYHGKMQDIAKKGIDAVVESGHHGIGYKQNQKAKDNLDETNFKNQSEYSPNIPNQNVNFVMVMPFEDQENISKFVRGLEPVRMSAGKPMGSRKHSVMDRYKNGGVSGVTSIAKRGDLIETQWLSYDLFNQDGVTIPSNYQVIAATSDEHIGSPEENPLVRDGMLSLYEILTSKDLEINGKPTRASGFISGGDTAEANSRRWNHRYHSKTSPQLVLEKVLDTLQKNPSNKDELIQAALKLTSLAREGSVENMGDILERVADYYEGFLKVTQDNTNHKWLHVSVTGNHADGVLRDLGMRESDYFVQRLKAKEIDVYEVGKPKHFDEDKDPRVAIGGYSSARIINIEDYGKTTQGTNLFGPINLVVQHDPKGGNFNGLVGAAKNVNADLALAGHTHETYVKIFNKGDNKFGVAYRMATLQGVSPTEKYYASSVPRTQAGHLFAMPYGEHFIEITIPAKFLEDVGMRALENKIKNK
jgi:hypothetical protein